MSSLTHVPLGALIQPAPLKRAGNADYPILSMTMRSGLVDQSAKFRKRVASVDTASYKTVRRGQLVVGFPIDEAVLAFQRHYDVGIVSPAYEVWEIRRPEKVSEEFLERYLRSPEAITYYKAHLRGSTARRRSLPRETFLQLPIPLPPLPEQRRIAAILDAADALRAKRRATIAALDTLTQSIFLDMFGDPGSNPKGWQFGKIGDIIDSAQYGTSAKAGSAGEVPVLRMNNITRTGDIDLTDLKYLDLTAADMRKYLVRPGDVLFNRTNSPELVGKSAIFRGGAEMAFAGYLIRVRTARSNDPEYLAAFLNSRYAKAVLRTMCKSIIGMANINAQELRTIKIPLPPTELQHSFALAVAGVERAKARPRESLEALDSLFASLQSRAFRGEL